MLPEGLILRMVIKINHIDGNIKLRRSKYLFFVLPLLKRLSQLGRIFVCLIAVSQMYNLFIEDTPRIMITTLFICIMTYGILPYIQDVLSSFKFKDDETQ